jgi:hypothetical protein
MSAAFQQGKFQPQSNRSLNKNGVNTMERLNINHNTSEVR